MPPCMENENKLRSADKVIFGHSPHESGGRGHMVILKGVFLIFITDEYEEEHGGQGGWRARR